jgi:hypothetical protein
VLGKVKKFAAWNRLGLRLDRLKKEIDMDAQASNYDASKTLAKGAKGLGEGALAVVLPVLLAYFMDSAAVTEALTKAGVKESIVALAVPLIVAGARMFANYRKHA